MLKNTPRLWFIIVTQQHSLWTRLLGYWNVRWNQRTTSNMSSLHKHYLSLTLIPHLQKKCSFRFPLCCHQKQAILFQSCNLLYFVHSIVSSESIITVLVISAQCVRSKQPEDERITIRGRPDAGTLLSNHFFMKIFLHISRHCGAWHVTF